MDRWTIQRAAQFHADESSAGRLEAFSDGVLGVAITLLIVGIKVPDHLQNEAALWAALCALVPAIATWIVSSAFVLTFWVSHHYFFASLRHVDRGLLWLNGLFLLFITLTPFATGLIAQYPGLKAPLAILSLVMALTAASFLMMRWYSMRNALVREHVNSIQRRAAIAQSALAVTLYAVALGVAFVWPVGSVVIQAFVLFVFILGSPNRPPSAQPSR